MIFQPGTVSDKGSSDFETKPNAFKAYPTKLIGDQILINSGRIILSARNAEMIFYSKKNYGFISDGAMSIDNKLGINVSTMESFILQIFNNNLNTAFDKLIEPRLHDSYGNNGCSPQGFVAPMVSQ